MLTYIAVKQESHELAIVADSGFEILVTAEVAHQDFFAKTEDCLGFEPIQLDIDLVFLVESHEARELALHPEAFHDEFLRLATAPHQTGVLVLFLVVSDRTF